MTIQEWSNVEICSGTEKKGNILIRMMVPIFFGFGKLKRFKPDLYIEDGYDLSGYGFDAKVLHLPGHSKGSIGILTTGGDLFCGDLFMNTDKPVPTYLVDDSAELNASIEKLKSLKINTVYPGHDKLFPWERIIKKQDYEKPLTKKSVKPNTTNTGLICQKR